MNGLTVVLSTYQLAGIVAMIMFSSNCVVSQQQVVFPLVPLGQYPFLGGFSTPSSNPSTSAPSDDNPAISRKLVDNSNPSDTAFIDSCKGYVGNAALRCPCAAPGRRCADAASLCKNSQCICDPSLGYMDNAGKNCIRYATTTATTTAKPTTCAPCSACTCPACTCPTTTSIPCTTAATPTTTALVTTTAAPDKRCGNNIAVEGSPPPPDDMEQCVFLNKGESKRVQGLNVNAGNTFLRNIAFSCPGASFQVDITFIFPNTPLCHNAFVNIYGTPLCYEGSPSQITIPAPFFSVAIFKSSTAGATAGVDFTVTCV